MSTKDTFSAVGRYVAGSVVFCRVNRPVTACVQQIHWLTKCVKYLDCSKINKSKIVC